MIRVKTGKEYSERYVKRSMMAYLDGEKNTSEKWITGIVSFSSGSCVFSSDDRV